jgi:hypothetical protein
MQSGVLEEQDLLKEIRMWLTLSKLFYRAFQIKRHLGPEWFVINSLLDPSNMGTTEFSVRNLLKTMPVPVHKKSSKNHDLSGCLDHLRELHHIEVLEPPSYTHSRGLGARSSFLVATKIKLRQKLLKATHRYVRGVLREFYGAEFAKKHSVRYVDIMGVLYEFGKDTFMDYWGKLLKKLASNSSIPGRTIRDAFFDEMLGSTEYFVLLFSLWEMRLIGDDDEGYRKEMLLSLHLFTRHVGDTALLDCVDQLIRHQVLEEVSNKEEEPHYRLAARHEEVFVAFGKELVTFRGLLLSKIELSVANQT